MSCAKPCCEECGAPAPGHIVSCTIPIQLSLEELQNNLSNLLRKLEAERDDERAQKERILGLLRDTKMSHGMCQPRERKACTACNAQEILDQIVKDWKGFTMVLS